MKKLSVSRIIIIALIICLTVGATIFTASANNDEANADNPMLEIVSNNVSYAESIYILYAISNEGFDRAEYEIKMLFWNEAQETYALGTEKYSTTNEGKAKVKGKDCLIFYSDGIAAKEMTDDVYARACVVIGDKEYYSDVMKFSVLEYVHTMKEEGNVGNGEIKLFTTMLDYGTAAQNNFNHKTDRPANGKYHKISVIGGRCPDGFDKGRYLEGDKVIIKPNDAPDGKRFSHWIDEKGIIVSYDKEFEVNVGTSEKTYEAVYKDISSITAQLKLNTEIPYDATADKIDLPTAVTFEANGESVILELTWDTSSFIPETIGKQVLYANLKDTDAYNKYGIEPGSITMEVTTLPYTYELDQTTGEYILTGYFGSDSVITIPTSYRNVFITKIATRAFNTVDSLTSVTVPNSVKVIENGAFWYCDNIKEISVPFVGESASSSNSWFGWIFGANSYDVQNGLLPLKLETVTLVDGATKIPDYAFYNCSQIKTFNTPESITYMGYFAFRQCSLTEFTLPEGLRSFNQSFEECYDLKRINVNSIDIIYKVSYDHASSGLGGSIFAHGADLYCNGKLVTELVIPAGINRMTYSLFNGCSSIKSIYIPSSVIIGDRFAQFANMSSLETVVFEEGSSITTLYFTFQGCDKLKSINLEALTQLTKLESAVFSGCSSLTKITLPETVTSIGDACFASTAITEIVLPDAIQKIGVDTFSGCANLKKINIPAGVVDIGERAFLNCKSLSNITLPAGLTTIGNYAFECCTSIASITIPERVYSIGAYAFDGCYNLSQVTILSTRLSEIGVDAFAGANVFEIYNLSPLTLTQGAEDNGKIALNAKVIHTTLEAEPRVNVDEDGFITYFDGVDNLLIGYVGDESDIVLPDYENTTYRIYNNAFAYTAVKLTSVVIPDCVTEIGEYAFANRQNLTSITMADSITTIKDNAFWGSGLITIVIPDSVVITSSGVFDYCPKLTVINCEAASIPANWISGWNPNNYNVNWGYNNITTNSEYDYVLHGEKASLTRYKGSLTEITIPSTIDGYEVVRFGTIFANNTSLSSITIPDSVTYISSSAFYGCTSLVDVNIGNSVSMIGKEAFRNCRSLKNIIIPDSVISVCASSFYNCTSLKSITLGINVTRIESQTFRNCSSLTNIVIPSKVDYIGGGVFIGCLNLTSITIDSDNKFYKEIDGNIYTIDGKTLVQYSIAKSDESFTVPDGVIIINASAFRECSELVNVIIPNSVQEINPYAFYGCSSISNIYYTGSEEEWAAINIGSNNTELTNATIHYNYSAE